MTISAAATELKFKYVTTSEELDYVISVLSTETEIAIDTETANPRKIENPDWIMNIYNKVDKGSSEFAPFDPHTCEVRLIQLRGRDTEPFVVDLWKLKQQDVAHLAKFLEAWTGTFIAHNAKFDLKMLKGTLDVWIDRNGFIFDTMQASILLGNSVGGSKERGHKLLDIARDFLEIDLDKTEQASDWSVPDLSQEQLEYAAYDVTHLHALKDILKQALESLNQQEPLQIEMQVISPTARMEYNGIPVSLPVYNKVQEAAQYAMPLLLGKIGKYFQEQIGQALTPTYLEIQMADGSVKQQLFLLPWGGNKVGKDFLMSRTNLVKQMLLDLGLEIESTEKSELEAYRESHPGIGYLIDYWNLVKQSQFKYDEYMHPKTGRIHSTYKISGASTGRFSSSNLNLQQVPSKTYMKHLDGSMMNYRQCFEAPPGWLMISCDFSGQELCVMAALSADPLMVKTLNDGGDLHSEAAAGMFNIDPKDARQKKPNDPSGKSYRDYGKIVMFSLAYGKTAEGFAADWKIDKSEAKKIIQNFENRFPVLTKWLKRAGNLAETQNYSRLVNGAMRFVGDGKRADKDAAKRAGANYQIQGLSSWMTRKAMILLDERIYKENLAIELVASVHDELLAIFKYDDSCELAQLYLTDDKDKIGKEKESREVMQRCIDSNCGPHCAARYETIMGECMKEAGEFYLKQVVPAGFDANVRKYWSH